MAIYLSNEPRFDTRGLPEGYDPHKFYEYRYETLVKDAKGVESLIYKYIPFSVIRSFAIAIDPTWKFKVAPGVITPVKRTKYRITASVLQNHYRTQIASADSWRRNPNYKGISACWDPVATHFPVNTSKTEPYFGQPPLVDIVKDTTKRTRLLGSTQGELELFKSYIQSPPRTVRARTSAADGDFSSHVMSDAVCRNNGGAANGNYGWWEYHTDIYGPYGALFPIADHNALRNSEIAFCKALCSKNALSLLKGWSPYSRDYTLFRNVVELRDITKSITQLSETLVNLKKLFVSLGTKPKLRESIFDLRRSARDVPGEYLSFHFGWKQTYKDAMELLALPEKVSKRMNFLIRRAGKPTTFRSSRKIATAEKDISGFVYDTSAYEYARVVKSRIERESEVRLVINATFDFPPLNVPSCDIERLLDRIGLIPRPTDIYNLIPWTWLVDYFTGLGNYIECIDTINRDPGLINWGMISCRTSGKVITDFQSKSDFQHRTELDYAIVSNDTTVVENRHQSILHYECQTRSDVAGILGVKTTSVPTTLSTYQKSIIGALLAQRLR